MGIKNKTLNRLHDEIYKLSKEPKKAVLFIVALFLISLLFLISTMLQKIFLFTSLCIISGAVVYVNYILKIPLDFTPVFFFSVIITKTLGLWPTIIFIFVGGVLPTLIAGGKIDSTYLVFLAFMFLSNIVALFFSGSTVFVGIILSVIYFIGGGITSILTGEPAFKQTISTIFGLSITLFYFLKFGQALIALLS